MPSLISKPLPIRPMAGLPVFCQPIPLFLMQWMMMLGVLALHVTVYTYPDPWLGFGIFALSFVSMVMGYLIVRLIASHHTAWPRVEQTYRVDVTLLRRVCAVTALVAFAVVLINYVAFGPPPIMTLFGATTLNYVEYGKLKQVLNAAVMALAVLAILEPTLWRRMLIYAAGFLCMLAYATRGFLLVMLAQMLFSFCLTTRISKKKLYLIALATLIGAVLLSNFIGNSRAESTNAAFVAAFGIEKRFATWPMALLWVISYVSTPISNICWIVHMYHYTHPTLTFISSLLPAFWSAEALETQYIGPNIIDGVSTYLAKYYLDLWFVGIALINTVWGLVIGVMTFRGRMTRKVLSSSVLLAAVGFLFYADYISFLSILMELAVLVWVERHAFHLRHAEGTPG